MKNVLVVGIARSGIATLKILKKIGYKVIINDIKTEEQLGNILFEIDDLYDIKILSRHPNISELKNVDFIILSPGVPTDLEFINNARKNGIEVIGEVELAYRISNSKNIIGITGTNGKTTTTSLVYEMFKNANFSSYIVGNIGFPIIEKAYFAKNEDYLITELSSFQLETIKEFKPKISAILNITPDHLNRHKTMENYIEAKKNIFLNQSKKDILVLNYDNKITRQIGKNTLQKIKFFSIKSKLDDGVYLEGNNVILKDEDGAKVIINKDEIFILGEHNLENSMAAILIAYYSGISVEIIRRTLIEFKGVEHRIEFVKTINGVNYYNDSKGTNPDASIKAVEAMTSLTHLIAGGMDKKSDFDEFIKSFKGKIKSLILFGETKFIIEQTAKKYGFEKIFIVDNLLDAVTIAYKNAKSGENVLLSPACASWDMYKNFEERGNEFKSIVLNLTNI